MDFGRYVPKDKYDDDAIARAAEIGFPALNPILPDLLVWLQDANWPVATPAAELLSSAGIEIVPHIRAVLSSDDSVWKYWILMGLCPYLAPNVLAELRPDFERLAKKPTATDQAEEVHDAAFDLLRRMPKRQD